LYASVGAAWAVIVAAMSLSWFIERAGSFRRASRVTTMGLESISLAASPESPPAAD
jgi:hypothetical protein